MTTVGGEETLHPNERDVALIQVGLDEGSTSDSDPQWQFCDFFGLETTVPETVQPGEPLVLQLHWQSLAPAAEDYTVFVHVVGPDGEVLAQADRRPLDGSAPTFTWQAGQRLRMGMLSHCRLNWRRVSTAYASDCTRLSKGVCLFCAMVTASVITLWPGLSRCAEGRFAIGCAGLPGSCPQDKRLTRALPGMCRV